MKIRYIMTGEVGKQEWRTDPGGSVYYQPVPVLETGKAVDRERKAPLCQQAWTVAQA